MGHNLRPHACIDDREDLRPAALASLPPHCRRGTSTRPQDSTELAQRPLRVRHIHETQGTQRCIERAVAESQVFGIHTFKVHITGPSCGGDATGRYNHLLRDVGGDDLASRHHEGRSSEGHEASAAGDIKDSIARFEIGQFQKCTLCRLQLRLP
jgi:hypothetical protein